MWTRAELKQNAKDVLRNNYWMAFAVSLVYSLITGIVSSGSSFVNNSATGSASSTDVYKRQFRAGARSVRAPSTCT